MQGYAEGLAFGVIEDEKTAAKIIMDETEKMAALIDEILSLSRIESNDIKFHFEDIPLKPFLNNCLASIEILAGDKKIQLEVSPPNQTVKADALHLERAIINVLSNAVRYASTTIKVTCTEKKLIIWNDGSGVPEHELKQIFKRFYIGENGSTGIGLSLTNEVILRHGWKIHAENTAGGMQFIIRMK